MSRLEALMVALGMILLGMAAARADRPGMESDLARAVSPAVLQAAPPPL